MEIISRLPKVLFDKTLGYYNKRSPSARCIHDLVSALRTHRGNHIGGVPSKILTMHWLLERHLISVMRLGTVPTVMCIVQRAINYDGWTDKQGAEWLWNNDFGPWKN